EAGFDRRARAQRCAWRRRASPLSPLRTRRRRPHLMVGLLAFACLVLAGCGETKSAAEAPPSSTPAPATESSTSVAPTTTTPPPPSPSSAPQAQDCPLPSSGFDCDFQRRFAAAQAYVANRPGVVGIVLRDRQTGAVWRN